MVSSSRPIAQGTSFHVGEPSPGIQFRRHPCRFCNSTPKLVVLWQGHNGLSLFRARAEEAAGSRSLDETLGSHYHVGVLAPTCRSQVIEASGCGWCRNRVVMVGGRGGLRDRVVRVVSVEDHVVPRPEVLILRGCGGVGICGIRMM